MRRGLVLTLIVVHGLAVVTLAIAVGWTHSKPRPCLATFEQVQVGMTLAEVNATVGGPPGSYTTPGATVLPPLRGGEAWLPHASWLCDRAELFVIFDDDGRVKTPYIRDVTILPNRRERLVTWLTTGYDVPRFMWVPAGPFDLGELRNILTQ